MTFELPDLGYAYDALEPHIDALTMEIHHSKHHAAYTANLNGAIGGTDMAEKTIEELLQNHNDNAAVRNNGGGYWNHCFFWNVMSPDGGGSPTGALADAINDAFGSFEEMQTALNKAGMTRFGSGWAWLVVQDSKLAVGSTANQDSPLMGDAVAGLSGTPILGLDVWEHAYYLNYQNRRPDYIAAFFNVINWDEVARRFAEA